MGGAMLTGMAIGSIATTLPDHECSTIKMDGKTYEDCDGTIYEPVYKGDEVQYKVISTSN